MKTVFTDRDKKGFSNSENNYKKLNPHFVNSFYKFLTDKKVYQIEINSTYRTGKQGNHSRGIALDIHKIKNDKNYVFTVRDKEYSNKQDLDFFNQVKNKFGNNLIEYISPSKVYLQSGKVNRENLYSNKSKEDKIKILEDKKNTTLDKQHLHHLHIAIEPGVNLDYDKHLKNLKKDSNNKYLFGIILASGLTYYYIKKRKK